MWRVWRWLIEWCQTGGMSAMPTAPGWVQCDSFKAPAMRLVKR